MEPKTINLVVTVFISLVFVVAILVRRKYNQQTGSMWNTINKLHEDNVSLLDLYIEHKRKCDKQSKRIAELIELCDKLQPDLVKRNITTNDLRKLSKIFSENHMPKTKEQLNAWYLDKGLESVNRINEEYCKAMSGLNSTSSDQLISSAIDEQIKNLMFRNIVDNANKLGVDLNEEFYNSQKQK